MNKLSVVLIFISFSCFSNANQENKNPTEESWQIYTNQNATMHCQYDLLKQTSEVAEMRESIIIKKIINDYIFRAHFEELYAEFPITPNFVYSAENYQTEALNIFKTPTIIQELCSHPQSRFMLYGLLHRVEYIKQYR